MPAELIAADDGERAARALERCVAGGGVAVFPADGLYGLACDPLSPEAIGRIHAIKGRDDGKPSAVMYFTLLALRELLVDLPDPVRTAAARLLPGPVTLVVPNRARRYPLACRADPERLGLRLIEGPLAGAACPVFQTSANLSGEPAPAAFARVPAAIRETVDLCIDGGELTGLPSTVIDLCELQEPVPERLSGWRVLRQGGLTQAEIERRLGSTPEPG